MDNVEKSIFPCGKPFGKTIYVNCHYNGFSSSQTKKISRHCEAEGRGNPLRIPPHPPYVILSVLQSASSVGQGYGLAAPEVNKGSASYFVCVE